MIWTDGERNYIRDNADRLTDAEISIELSRITGRVISIRAIRKQRQQLNIIKKHGRGVCEREKHNEHRGLSLRINGTDNKL